MNFMTADQFAAANKANLETLFGLTHKAFEGVEKLVELNLQVARTTLGEAAQTTQAALSVKDAQELLVTASRGMDGGDGRPGIIVQQRHDQFGREPARHGLQPEPQADHALYRARGAGRRGRLPQGLVEL